MNPDKHTINEKVVDVGGGHNLYTQLWGNPASDRSFIFLHGGPGSNCKNEHKDFFDPERDRVLFFDQRGSGRSIPYGSLENNNTEALLVDIDKVADANGLDPFGIVGRSWGACLGLIYAIKKQERLKNLIIGGVFTARQAEIDHFYRGGYRKFFPDVWEDFVKSVPAEMREDPGTYHLQRVVGEDLVAAKLSAYALTQAGASITSLQGPLDIGSFDDFDHISTTVQGHYDVNNEFIPEGYILDNASSLKIPVSIVQGRFDMICPPITAIQLTKKIPRSNLLLVSAGHAGSDVANLEGMRGAVNAEAID